VFWIEDNVQQAVAEQQPIQRIAKVRRDYNRLVSDETLEDYALRFTPRSFRKWGVFRVANTAFGAVSFLALEAIGASVTMMHGFINASIAILLVSVMIFLTGLPVAYRAARHGLDMDLLARGAGFGYLGSTITSLVYASFTFIFFALEAAIMAQAFELWFEMPRMFGYLVSALVVIPLVTHGITVISRLQLWTQPLWLVLLVLPFIGVAVNNPGAFGDFVIFDGFGNSGPGLSWSAVGAAATVVASLIAQIGEQVDFLRFMPEAEPGGKLQWWLAVIVAGPGWIVVGAAKMFGGAFLAFLAMQHGERLAHALEPTRMYLAGFQAAIGDSGGAIFLTGLFVLISQIKINVTNAYAGSLAWSNFFARLTHSHPGRVVWLVFNVLIAILLMVMGVFEALNQVLGLYAHFAVAWIGSVVASLVISKPLGLSPDTIEFRRAYLYDINPAGFFSMLIASVVSIAAYFGLFGESLRYASIAVALAVSLLISPLISLIERKHYAIARLPVDFGPRHRVMRCAICGNKFEAEDMAYCPAYRGPICSLCCTLDARCADRCKTGARIQEQIIALVERWIPTRVDRRRVTRAAHFVGVFCTMVFSLGSILWLLYAQTLLRPEEASDTAALFWKLFLAISMLSTMAAWWLVLTSESRQVAQEESERQTVLLQSEIDAHRKTDAALQKAKEDAERANVAKSRFLTGMSHEMRSPLNSIIGYSQLLLRRPGSTTDLYEEALGTIHRNGEHLASLVEGLLELARIDAGKLRLVSETVNLREFLDEIVRMFRAQAAKVGLAFHYEWSGTLPGYVHTDAKRLRQILINLLGNAIKFTEQGNVTLRIRHQREIAHIEVEDTGVGIASDDHERVFMPFERVARARPSAEGTGIGLTITQVLVDLMGGDIRLESTPGKGTCFFVRLYLPVISNVSQAVPARTVSGYMGPRRHVLIVDDQSEHRRLLRLLLEPLGFVISEAASGREALETVVRQRPDLLLLDIGLKDMKGWDVSKTLRGNKQPLIPTIMISANAHENIPEITRNGLCEGFVAKPFDENVLLEQVQRTLDLHWLRSIDPDSPSAKFPESEVLRDLLALSAGNYPHALRARLRELAEESPDLGPWVNHCFGVLATNGAGVTDMLLRLLQGHGS